MLTDEGDTVMDPFAGSCSSGAVSESLCRKWICIDLELRYLEGAIGRFGEMRDKKTKNVSQKNPIEYRIPKAGSLWSDDTYSQGQLRRGKSRDE